MKTLGVYESAIKPDQHGTSLLPERRGTLEILFGIPNIPTQLLNKPNNYRETNMFFVFV